MSSKHRVSFNPTVAVAAEVPVKPILDPALRAGKTCAPLDFSVPSSALPPLSRKVLNSPACTTPRMTCLDLRINSPDGSTMMWDFPVVPGPARGHDPDVVTVGDVLGTIHNHLRQSDVEHRLSTAVTQSFSARTQLDRKEREFGVRRLDHLLQTGNVPFGGIDVPDDPREPWTVILNVPYQQYSSL
ncbi:hypothetical protein C8R46DRAFT_1065370 [Mycena filopes]|nr:hypothetical protein C8R46DRAFT_1065370 [Mycena filopes]